MQHRFKTERGEFLAVAVPDDASGLSVEIEPSEDWYRLTFCLKNDDEDSGFFGDDVEYDISIPKGDWQIIGPYPGIKEEQAASIVDKIIDNSPFSDDVKFKDYLAEQDLPFDYALPSFASLMEAERIYTVNPNGNKPIHKQDSEGRFIEPPEVWMEQYEKWQYYEERTSKQWIILKLK